MLTFDDEIKKETPDLHSLYNWQINTKVDKLLMKGLFFTDPHTNLHELFDW